MIYYYSHHHFHHRYDHFYFSYVLFLLFRLQYSSAVVPKTKSEWESFVFIDKTHWGYYTWPK